MKELKYTPKQLTEIVEHNFGASKHLTAALVENGIVNLLQSDSSWLTKRYIGKGEQTEAKNKKRERCKELALTNIRKRQYIWLYGETKTPKSRLFVFCPTHKEIHDVQLNCLIADPDEKYYQHGIPCCLRKIKIDNCKKNLAADH
jgi:hypothetical protein